MSTRELHYKIWKSSGSKSFYNSPHYADFMAAHGENIQLVGLFGNEDEVYIPISMPNVWTWYKTTKIPIPPRWGQRNSTYLGMLSKSDQGLGDPQDILLRVKELKNKFEPVVRVIQPALLDTGITPDLERWIDVIKSSGVNSSDTETRILELPFGNTPSNNQIFDLSLETILDSDNFDELLSTYDSKRRYDIRRAPRVGVSADVQVITSSDQADSVYGSIMDLHRDSWGRTGLGAHTLEYWTGYSQSIRESGAFDVVVRAFYEQEIVSVVVIHVRGASAFYQMNSSSLTGQKMSANPYALHLGITSASLLGAKYFELGRYSDTDALKTRQINDYKSQFGGFVVPVPNFDTQLKV